jgi:hypothetical protein
MFSIRLEKHFYMTVLARLTVPAVFAAALFAAAPAQAVVTISQTIDFSRLFSATSNTVANGGTDVALFNLYGGPASNLAGVRITWVPDFNSSVFATVTNGSRPTLEASLASSYTLNNSLFNFSGALNTGTAVLATTRDDRGNPLTLDPIFTQPAALIAEPTDISAFVGSGTSSVSYTLASISRTTSQSGGSNPFTGHGGSAGGSLQIDYFLLEPLPEPGTWAMLIAGFGLIGTSMRRRRLKVAHAA